MRGRRTRAASVDAAVRDGAQRARRVERDDDAFSRWCTVSSSCEMYSRYSAYGAKIRSNTRYSGTSWLPGTTTTGSAAAGRGTRAPAAYCSRFARCVKSPLATMTSAGSSCAARSTASPTCRRTAAEVQVGDVQHRQHQWHRRLRDGQAGERQVGARRDVERRDGAALEVEQRGARDHGGIVRGEARRGREQLAVRRRARARAPRAARGSPRRRRRARRAGSLRRDGAHVLRHEHVDDGGLERCGDVGAPRSSSPRASSSRTRVSTDVFRPLNENA
jgi:hypothetical protein